MSDTSTFYLAFLPIVSLLIGSAISFWTTKYFTTKADGRAIRQTSAQLAQYLDVFAYKCSEVIGDNDTFSQSDGHAGAIRTSLPELGELPLGADLGLIEPIALSKLLALKLKWKLAQDKIRFWFDTVGEPDCMPSETDQQCGVLGTEALEIAALLRNSAKLPYPKYDEFYWDFSKLLRAEREQAIKEVKRNKEG